MSKKQPVATHPGRKRIEEQNPKLVDEMLQYAAAHGAVVYGVHPRTIERAIERHYTEPLRLERYAEVAEANEQIEHLSELCSETEQQLAIARAELADAHEHLALMAQQAQDTVQQNNAQWAPTELSDELSDDPEVAELQNALTAALVELHLHRQPLYAVQQVTDLSRTASAVQGGAQVGLLDGQLVTIRPVYVYDGSCAVAWSNVITEGASMCTAAALLAAGLPVPAGAR